MIFPRPFPQYLVPTELGPREEAGEETPQAAEKEAFVAFCRIYSGRIEPGKQVRTVGKRGYTTWLKNLEKLEGFRARITAQRLICEVQPGTVVLFRPRAPGTVVVF